MKKIVFVLLILFLLSSCESAPIVTIPPESSPSTTVPDEPSLLTPAPYENPPSYERIRREVDAYFRMFYVNNQNYKWNCIESSMQISQDGSWVIGYFDSDSLVKMVLESYGERAIGANTYYLINENLTYCIDKTCWQYIPPHGEDYREYFIINGTMWKYDNETNGLIEDEIEYWNFDEEAKEYIKVKTNEDIYFSQALNELTADKPWSFVKNATALPTENNLFTQFNNLKNEYFKKLFSGDIYEKAYFKMDLPTFLPESNNVNVIFEGSDILKLYVDISDETSYTGYEYYPIDDTHIYVEVYYQDFESRDLESYEPQKYCWDTDFNDMNKNCYGEYFIVDGKVMVYDPQVMDLVESPDNSEVLAYFNVAKEEVHLTMLK